MSQYLLILCVLIISSCVASKQPPLRPSPYKHEEKVHHITASSKSILIGVNSTGCTKPQDFIIDTMIKGDQCLVTIYRIKPDVCKRATFKTDIELPWNQEKSCSNSNIVFKNQKTQNSPNRF